jgi:hypothetical protein
LARVWKRESEIGRVGVKRRAGLGQEAVAVRESEGKQNNTAKASELDASLLYQRPAIHQHHTRSRY